MTSEMDIVRSTLEASFPDRVFAVEDGTVWVSGLNSRCESVARQMAKTLVHGADIPCSLVYDDGAARFGGVQFDYGRYA